MRDSSQLSSEDLHPLSLEITCLEFHPFHENSVALIFNTPGSFSKGKVTESEQAFQESIRLIPEERESSSWDVMRWLSGAVCWETRGMRERMTYTGRAQGHGQVDSRAPAG